MTGCCGVRCAGRETGPAGGDDGTVGINAERGTVRRDSVHRPLTVPVVCSVALSGPSTTVSFALLRASTSTVPEYGS